jgi:hypothetical protein
VRGRVHTGEVGLDGVREVGVPEVAVALAELHLVELSLRRHGRRRRWRGRWSFFFLTPRSLIWRGEGKSLARRARTDGGCGGRGWVATTD